MSHIVPLDHELAQFIVDLIAPDLQSPRKRHEPEVRAFGHAIATKQRGGKPSNKVYRFGHQDLPHLDDILTFFAEDGLEPSFYLTPIGFTRQVALALTTRGLVPVAMEQAILYGDPHHDIPHLSNQIAIERVTPETRNEFVQVKADGFEWHPAWRDAAIKDASESFDPQDYHYLARFGGKPAGVATLNVRKAPRPAGLFDGKSEAIVVGALSDGAVAPEFRRRGIHIALIHHRLCEADRLGCKLITGAADYCSGSFRNQVRCGLSLAYVESEWARPITD